LQYALSFLGYQALFVCHGVSKSWKVSACAVLHTWAEIDLSALCSTFFPTPAYVLRAFNPSVVTTITIDLSKDRSKNGYLISNLGCPGHVFKPRVLNIKKGLWCSLAKSDWLDLSDLVSLTCREQQLKHLNELKVVMSRLEKVTLFGGQYFNDYLQDFVTRCPALRDVEFELDIFSSSSELVTLLQVCPLIERIGSSGDKVRCILDALTITQTQPHLRVEIGLEDIRGPEELEHVARFVSTPGLFHGVMIIQPKSYLREKLLIEKVCT
jgi:hypothetical protein